MSKSFPDVVHWAKCFLFELWLRGFGFTQLTENNRFFTFCVLSKPDQEVEIGLMCFQQSQCCEAKNPLLQTLLEVTAMHHHRCSNKTNALCTTRDKAVQFISLSSW